MDVRDYLERIQARIDEPPSLEALTYLHERHLMSVPFENLDIHFGVPIVLDQETILDKIVRRRRGGFCYELNACFAWLLSNLGYRVTMLSAEVARPDGSFGIPFDHMTLRVDIGEHAFLADVGFGESFLQPLPLVERGGEAYRLIRHDDSWRLEHESEPKYRFTLEPHGLEDFEPGCQYHQASPESTFTQRVVTTRATPDGRITLTKERFIENRGGKKTVTTLSGDAEWHRALKEHFDIVLENVSCGSDPS